MHGGYLRFQAQYLRRIRLPRWEEVPRPVRDALTIAAEQGDVTACNQAVFKLYNLSREERTALSGNGE
jgi:PAS domain-containing protein